MKSAASFVKTTVIGGFFVVLPVAPTPTDGQSCDSIGKRPRIPIPRLLQNPTLGSL